MQKIEQFYTELTDKLSTPYALEWMLTILNDMRVSDERILIFGEISL